jgi:hypothetical protein
MYQLQGASAYKKDMTNAYLLSNHLKILKKKISVFTLLEQTERIYITYASLYFAWSRL